jgi:hypothetical protein
VDDHLITCKKCGATEDPHEIGGLTAQQLFDADMCYSCWFEEYHPEGLGCCESIDTPKTECINGSCTRMGTQSNAIGVQMRGYASLAAIRKAESFLGNLLGWGVRDPKVRLEMYERGSLPGFEIYWDGAKGGIYYAKFTWSGEFIELIKEDWVFSSMGGSYLAHQKVNVASAR